MSWTDIDATWRHEPRGNKFCLFSSDGLQMCAQCPYCQKFAWFPYHYGGIFDWKNEVDVDQKRLPCEVLVKMTKAGRQLLLYLYSPKPLYSDSSKK
jgi:hypothetical protein